MAILSGSGGCLLLWPLHVCLPHARLPVLQEKGHQLQGEISVLISRFIHQNSPPN